MPDNQIETETMTKIRFMSDLHLEFDDAFRIVPEGEDVLVLAGDVSTGRTALPFIRHYLEAAGDVEVVYILGNHEAYGTLFGRIPDLWSWQDVRDWWRAEAASHPRLHFLENDIVTLGGARFLGATLWTDFRAGPDDEWSAMWHAELGMNDFRVIGWRLDEDAIRRLAPEDTRDAFGQTRAWIREQLATPFEGSTVAVTHHAPSTRSNAPFEKRAGRSPLSPCFASNLEGLMTVEHAPALWIHGHVHDTLDYRVGNTRVVCNPRGYIPEQPNPEFNPGWTIEV